jgi:dTDP-4-dehydrorhamnose 3,5-epimerase
MHQEVGRTVHYTYSPCSGDLILQIGKTAIGGVYSIRPKVQKDERGFFARTFCKDELTKHGIETDVVQCNISFNKNVRTLRGLHYQCAPFEEAKFVSCPRGKIFDVVVDLRQTSPTFLMWEAFDINEDNNFSVYIPKGCAHGFMTCEPDTMVYYQMTEFYHPECACGIRWDDPTFRIIWPQIPECLSDKDTNYPDYRTQGDLNHE